MLQLGFFSQRGEGSSKAAKASKKTKKDEQPKPVQDSVEKDVPKEVVPLNTCILKRTKKPAHRPHHSPKRPIVQEVSNQVSSTKGITKIRKPQINKRGVLIRELLAPMSPTSKK